MSKQRIRQVESDGIEKQITIGVLEPAVGAEHDFTD